jgi:TRAP-type C4-dicarboxylate transport system permease small subunit
MTSLFVDALVTAVRAVTRPVIAVTYIGFTIVVVAQVFFRYVLNDSLVWAEEFVRYALLWSVLLGASLVSERREHINVDFLREQLTPRGQRVLDLINAGVVLCFCACLVWFGIKLAQRSAFAVSPAAGFPMAWVYAAMPIGGVLIGFFTLQSLRRTTQSSAESDVRADAP